MKAFVGVLLTGALVLAAGCNDKSADTTTASQPTNTVGNPLTAPVDYLGAVAKAKVTSERKVDLISLNNAIQQYQALEGHLPKDLDEMVTAHYYPHIPPPPTGTKYDYNPTTGVVKLVPK